MAKKRSTTDRDQLIRAHFEAYSDLVWAQDLEPKFREYNLDAAEMKEYREAWNRHTEARDWEWWLGKVKGVSNAKLRQEIAECKAETDTIRKETPAPGVAELSAALFGDSTNAPQENPEVYRAMQYLKEYRQRQEKQYATDGPRDEGYYGTIGRNGTEDEITIHAPDDRPMAHIWFWDEEHDEPGVGDKQAKADAQLILDALNAYPSGSSRGEATEARAGMVEGYHTTPGRDPFGQEDAINIRAPDGHTMAFLWLSDQPDRAKADAQRMVDALNAYQPRHLPGKQASATELAATLFGDGANAPQQGPELHQGSGRGSGMPESRADVVQRISQEIEQVLVGALWGQRLFIELPQATQRKELNDQVDWTGLTTVEKEEVIARVLKDVRAKVPEEIYPAKWFDGMLISVDRHAKVFDLGAVREQIDTPGRDKNLDERVCPPHERGGRER